MKSPINKLTPKTTPFFLLSVILCFLFHSGAMAFQFSGVKKADRSFDHVINTRGESRLSFFTGLPIVGSSEFAYGITDRLTAGILIGFTPFEEAVGVRIRRIFYQRDESYRIYFCTPVVFYPQSRRLNPDPWYLTRPNINFEWLSRSGLRYKVGGSIIATASHRDLFESSKHAGVWTAVHGGISMPFVSSMTFQTELSYVMKGIRTIDNFFGGPPVILIVGVSYTF